MSVQKGALKEKIDLVQFLTLEQRQRLTKLFDALAKVPNVGAEQTKLDSAFKDWTAALNKVNLLVIVFLSCWGDMSLFFGFSYCNDLMSL